MSSLEKTLLKKLNHLPREAAPGVRVLVAQKGQKVLDVSWGKTWPYYDLASLTKVIFTATQYMSFESRGMLLAEDPVVKHLPWYNGPATIAQLLSHVAGNVWWLPLYKEIMEFSSLYEKRQHLQKMIRDLEPKPESQAVYSDIDFFILGFIVENLEETSLDLVWSRFRDRELPDSHLHFNKNNSPVYKRSAYAPTENCPWRKKIIQGEVHDENTWSLLGVSSHAGLFGRPQDVLDWGLWLRKAASEDTAFTRASIVQKYLRRAIPRTRGDWALGFMMPTEGKASCGAHFDLKSVGHTGFTGTSFWWDRKKDVMAVVLANRTYPTRENEMFRRERPKIHNMIMETLTE